MSIPTELLSTPAYAPARRDVATLVAELDTDDDDRAKAIVKAVVRVPDSTLPIVLAVLPSTPKARPRLIEILGRLGDRPGVDVALLGGYLADDDAKTRKAAVRALGRIAGEAATEQLALALPTARDQHLEKALVEALGKRGDEPARIALATIDDAAVPTAARAKARAARDVLRADDSTIDADAPLSPGTLLSLAVRQGLEPLLCEELEGRGARQVADGEVTLKWEGPLAPLFSARTFMTIAILPPTAPMRGARVSSIASAITSKPSLAVLRGLTRGPLRYRLSLTPPATRAEIEEIAALVAARAPDLVNDPRDSVWEIAVTTTDTTVRVALRPRALDDPRFAYRRGDVPAASHPTVAAALARLAGVVDDDVVWDPFVGSGLELAERSLLGPALRFVGTDRDPRALAVAKRNLTAAGAHADLSIADARTHRVPGLSLVLTNPPMGRRTGDGHLLRGLLDTFLENAASQLVPGGRIVWISPMAGTRHLADKLGLQLRDRFPIDMGGFTAEVQLFAKRR